MKLDFDKDLRKKNEFVCNTKGGGNYVKAASNSFGITDEQSILNLARQLSKHITEVPPLNWCTAVEQLLKKESINQLLLILSAMRKEHGHK